MLLDKHIFSATIFVVLCIKLKYGTSAATGPTHGKNVVCYLASWSVHRPSRGSFEIEDVDPTLCTHIIYSFAGLNVNHDGIISLDPQQDLTDGGGKGGYSRVVALKKNYPHLKISLAIGGRSENSSGYFSMVGSSTKRKNFVANAVEFLKKYNFDGLDLNWEFPRKRPSTPENKLNFVSLVQQLRSEFTQFNFLLTAAFGTGRNSVGLYIRHRRNKAYDVKRFLQFLDFLHLMCYDYHQPENLLIGPNAPLISATTLNVQYTVLYLIRMGASPAKLILGIPLYGKTYILDEERNYIESRSSWIPKNHLYSYRESKFSGFQGQFTKTDGFMGYNEICVQLQNSSSEYTMYWDEYSHTPYAVSGDKLITYDDEKSILEKVEYSVSQKLGGVMVWSIDTDDFRGDCGSETYPLLRSINRNIEKFVEDIKGSEENETNNFNQNSNKDGGSSKISADFIILCAGLVTLIIKLNFYNFMML